MSTTFPSGNGTPVFFCFSNKINDLLRLLSLCSSDSEAKIKLSPVMSCFAMISLLTLSLDILYIPFMQVADFEKTRAALMGEKSALIEQRTSLENELIEIRQKISHLEEILNHLAPLVGIAYDDVNDIPKLGLTDAIRTILKSANGDRMSAGDVRQKLIDCGYDLTELTAPMQSIYKILSRITEDENSDFEREKEEYRVYFKWKGISDDDIPI